MVVTNYMMVKSNDLNNFDLVDEIKGVKLYTSVVNSLCFKRNLSIVYLVKQVDNKVYNAIFY